MRVLAGDEVAMTEEEEKRVAALEAEGESLSDEWSDADDVPDEVHARLEAIDAEISWLGDRPAIYDPVEVAVASAFVSTDPEGRLRVARGFVKPEDAPVAVPREERQSVGKGKRVERRV